MVRNCIITIIFILGACAKSTDVREPRNLVELMAISNNIKLNLKQLPEITASPAEQEKIVRYLHLFENRDTTTYSSLGDIYQFGFGVEKDEQKALHYYLKWAKVRNRDIERKNAFTNFKATDDTVVAPNQIPPYFRRAYNFSSISHRARVFLLKRALNKNVEAQYYYAKTSFDPADIPLYTPVDYIPMVIPDWPHDAKLIWLIIAAENGHRRAIEELTDIKQSGSYDKIETRVYAQIFLGDIFAYSNAVNRDYEQALKYYQNAATLDSHIALTRIGKLYEHGLGVPQSYQKAREYYIQGKSYYDLGRHHENGLDIPKDIDQAKQWYVKGALENNFNSYDRLVKIYNDAEDGQPDVETAYKWAFLSHWYGAENYDFHYFKYEDRYYWESDLYKTYKWLKEKLPTETVARIEKDAKEWTESMNE